MSAKGASISSVAVSELLLMYNAGRTTANYYVPVLSTMHLMSSLGSSKLDHPFSKRLTDRIVFDFGNDFDPIIEFGSNAITKVVNGKNIDILRQSIRSLEKGQQRNIRENFNFLLANEIHCVSLTPAIVEDAYQLLWDFRNSGHNLKAAFRNSWNDILILATARSRGGHLMSDDSELNRFAASSLQDLGGVNGLVEITLDAPAKRTPRKQSRESKGYTNRGWRAHFDKAG